MSALLAALAAAALAALAAAQGPESAVIRSAVPWFDTSGNRIYAGGANMYEENGVYYLVGEGKKVLDGDCSACFNLYKSTDLESWDFVSCVLRNQDIVAPGKAPYRMERPKIFKCPGNQRHTMWFHCDSVGFGLQSVGVLTADAVEGPYTFAAPCFQPDGQRSYDMGTFVDPQDGRAYLIRSVNNQFAGISQMTEDCLNVTGIVSSGPDMEGQALMRDEAGVLHAAGSHLTGWASNAAQFVTSPNASLVGAQWVDNYNPSASPTTYDSQSTFIFPFKHADGHTTFIWMADRWNANGPGGLDNMTNIWLPLLPPPANGSQPSYAGSSLVEAVCSASDPSQVFTMPPAGGGALLHAASGLCLTAAGSGSEVALAACAGPGAGAQAWTVHADDASITSGTGAQCLRINAQDDLPHQPGNPVVGWTCSSGSAPAWNEQWLAPAPGATGVVQARFQKGGGASNLCLSAPPSSGARWTLPWLSEWSLKDY